MKNFIRVIAFLVAACTAVSFGGCFDYSYIDDTSDTVPDKLQSSEKKMIDEIKINLAYNSADSLDPYAAKSDLNRNLSSLIYDSLFEVDNTFKAVAQIAESYVQTEDKITVTLKESLYFSDSSALGAEDVVYSFNTAKTSERYKTALSVFKSAESSGSNVDFYFAEPCPEGVNLLSFPIIKSNSFKNGTKTDISLGSGRYTLSENKDGTLYLTCNEKRLGGYTPVYRNLGLVSASDNESIHSLFSLGHSNFITETFNDGNYTQTIGATNKITLSNVVYLVCKKSNKIFEDPKVKQAISLAINRDEIADYSFINYAKSAYTPLHPDYYKTAKRKNENETFDIQKSKDALDSAGFTNINPKYNFRYADGKILEFNLAVCKENSFKVSAAKKIKEQLDAVGIQVSVKEYEEKDFLNAVKSGKYDMYIGECKLTNALDLSVFFTEGSAVSYGIDAKCESAQKYTDYKNGSVTLDDFLDTFTSEMPFIPLLYRYGAASANSAMAVADNTIVTDYYYNAENWKSIND